MFAGETVLGKAYFKDYDSYIEYIHSEEGKEWYTSLWENRYEYSYSVKFKTDSANRDSVSIRELTDRVVKWSRNMKGGKEYTVKDPFKEIIEYENRFNKGFDLLYEEDDCCVIRYATIEDAVLVPKKFLDIQIYKDYSEMTVSEMKSLKGESYSLMANDSLTINGVKEEKAENESKLESLKSEIENVEKNRTGELAELQAEIEKKQAELEEKKNSLLNELAKKKKELNIKIASLNKTVYQLSTEIYAIQCFYGEVIDFVQLRSGRKADKNTPMVLYQKVRYMDDEMAKKMALCDADYKNHKLFEDFLALSPDAEEIFYPDEKCVMAVRCSKTGMGMGYVCDREGNPLNMLGYYDKCHGKKVGIIVRDGECLYMGWTDDTKLTIKSDLFQTSEKAPDSSEDIEELMKKVEREMDRQAEAAEKGEYLPTSDQKDYVSRYFLFNILQGFIDRGIIGLPENVSLVKDSPYVVYSNADNWIHTTKYGSFTEILKKYTGEEKKGDTIVTLMRIYDNSGYVTDYYRKDIRGHGDAYGIGRGSYDRARGAVAKDRTLYKINLVETDSYDEKHVFISVPRDVWKWDAKPGLTCNFELMSDEYINITFLNTLLIDDVLKSEDFGGWRINGSQVTYSYGASYLWKAKEYLLERERSVEGILRDRLGYKKLPEEWQMMMSDWMMENGIHTMTEYQVKRFSKILQ